MSSNTRERVVASPRRFTGALVGGLLAGVLDITYAYAFAGFHGRSPLRVLQSVASDRRAACPGR
jgi:hypothetical protein